MPLIFTSAFHKCIIQYSMRQIATISATNLLLRNFVGYTSRTRWRMQKLRGRWHRSTELDPNFLIDISNAKYVGMCVHRQNYSIGVSVNFKVVDNSTEHRSIHMYRTSSSVVSFDLFDARCFQRVIIGSFPSSSHPFHGLVKSYKRH